MTAAAFCRQCGKALTEEEKAIPSTIYCAACAATQSTVEMPAQPVGSGAAPAGSRPISPAGAAMPLAVDNGISPGLAFLLGLIPGVGAIYNAQYAKGLIHVVIFGLLLSIADSPNSGDVTPIFATLIPSFVAYMAFEAYHTAKRRAAGQLVDEFSSLVPMRQSGFPVAPVLLIASGVLFLLNNLGVLHFNQLFRWWPVLLIALGVYMLYVRLTGGEDSTAPPSSGGFAATGFNNEVRHEQ
ncbi:MAG: hypothetical protein IPJ98_23925 [Bryobacterales bacterium]|nr:hypothetical protein [Bryobacterales bacterium]